MGAPFTATLAIPGQTITGSGGVDTLRSSTGADTIVGGAGNDTIFASVKSDSIDGGLGTDVYRTVAAQFNVANGEGSGTGISTGIVVNLGSTAVTAANVLSVTGNVISGGLTSVAPTSASYLYTNSLATNSPVTDTLTSIENVHMESGGENYVVGSDGANTIIGGAGVDFIVSGKGNDIIQGAAGVDVINAGAGNDTIQMLDTAELNRDEVINGGTGANNVTMLSATTGLDDNDFDAMDLIQTFNFSSAGANTGVFGAKAAAAGIVSINGGDGVDTITVSTGGVTITPGKGADIITGGLGVQTIDLTEAVAAADDIGIVTGLTSDSVTAFAVAQDDILIDSSALDVANASVATKTTDIVDIHDNNSTADANGTPAAMGIQILTAAAVAADAKNFFVIDLGTTKFLNAAAAVDVLEASGAAALTFAGNIAAADSFYFAYENTVGGTGIALATFIAGDNNSSTAAVTGAGNLIGTDLVTLVGVSNAATLTTAVMFHN